MKTIHFSTEKSLLLIILALILFNLLSKRCSEPISEVQKAPKTTIVRDTIWQTKIDTFKLQTTRYKTVYVDSENLTNISETFQEGNETSKIIEAKIFKDTLSNNDLDIFSYSLVEGNLLKNQISYKLKVPKEVTITKTIEHPKTYKSGLYLFSEIGGNPTRFDNISLGLQYNRKGKWFVSYRANLNQLQQSTHNIGVGVRLFK